MSERKRKLGEEPEQKEKKRKTEEFQASFQDRVAYFLSLYMPPTASENPDDERLLRNTPNQIGLQRNWVEYLLEHYQSRFYCLPFFNEGELGDLKRGMRKFQDQDFKIYREWKSQNPTIAKRMGGFAVPSVEVLLTDLVEPEEIEGKTVGFVERRKVGIERLNALRSDGALKIVFNCDVVRPSNPVPIPLYEMQVHLVKTAIDHCSARSGGAIPLIVDFQLVTSAKQDPRDVEVKLPVPASWPKDIPSTLPAIRSAIQGHTCLWLLNPRDKTATFFDPVDTALMLPIQQASRVASDAWLEAFAKRLGMTRTSYIAGPQCPRGPSRSCNAYSLLYFHLQLDGFTDDEINRFWDAAIGPTTNPKTRLQLIENMIHRYQHHMLILLAKDLQQKRGKVAYRKYRREIRALGAQKAVASTRRKPAPVKALAPAAAAKLEVKEEKTESFVCAVDRPLQSCNFIGNPFDINGRLENALTADEHKFLISPQLAIASLAKAWGYWSGKSGDHINFEKRIHNMGPIYTFTSVTDVLWRYAVGSFVGNHEFQPQTDKYQYPDLKESDQKSLQAFLNEFLNTAVSSGGNVYQRLCLLASYDLDANGPYSWLFGALVVSAKVIILTAQGNADLAKRITKKFRQCLNAQFQEYQSRPPEEEEEVMEEEEEPEESEYAPEHEFEMIFEPDVEEEDLPVEVEEDTEEKE